MDFSGADLSGALLDHCDLSGAKFVETNLRRAYLGWSTLEGADLTRAEINEAVFTNGRLHNVRLLAYSVSLGRHPINLTADSFRPLVGFGAPKINESAPRYVEPAYRALKAIFVGSGDYDSASWASFRERRMNRKNLWKQHRYLRWLASLLFGLTTGYGERPARVVLSSTALIGGFAYLYYCLGLISPGPSRGLGGFGNALYFSVATFCTFSAPLVGILSTAVAKGLVALEAFIGMFVMGLFIFTLTRRYVAR